MANKYKRTSAMDINLWSLVWQSTYFNYSISLVILEGYWNGNGEKPLDI